MTGPRALLLCAGKGRRLLPLTEILPKCLMPINGRPLLEYWLQTLCDAGFEKVLVNLHHHAQLVRKFIAVSRYAEHVSTAYETELLGTGGTLLANADFFGDSPILVAHGDNLTIFDAAALLEAHRARPNGCDITMMTFVAQNPRHCGIVETSSSGIVTAFHEKVASPPGNIANAAVYVVQPSVIDFLRKLRKKIVDFSTEVIPAYVNKIFVYHNHVYHRDIGTLESLVMAQFDYALASRSHEGMASDHRAGPHPFYADEKARLARFLQTLDMAVRAAGAGTGSPSCATTDGRD